MTTSTPPQPERSASTTPVLAGFYPDPSVCRVGDAYYLANSSFEYAPGVPIHRSIDLVSWTPLGHVLERDEQWPAGQSRDSLGIYAPTLRHHDGRFWMITTDVAGAGGQLLVSALDASGPWSAPVRVPELHGIDPDIAWDGDGSCLVTFSGTHDGASAIMQAEVDVETGQVLEQPHALWSGTGLAHPEAPHLYEHEGWWYLLIAEGGTERGHTVAVARSRSPRGPFTGAPHNPVLTHRSTTHPVQNTGHADLVERPDGTWAMVFLGVRPRGATPGFHVNGRETFLTEIEWRGGWPHVTPSADLVPLDPGFADDFSTWPLHPRWISPGLRPSEVVEALDDSGLLLRPALAPSGTWSMLAARCTAQYWRATADVDPLDGIAALRVRLDERHWVEVRAGSGALVAVVRVGGIEHELGRAQVADAGPVTLQVRSVPSLTGGPDDLELTAGGHELGRVDGRYLSTEVTGGFTGRVWGLRAIDAPIAVHRAGFEPLPG